MAHTHTRLQRHACRVRQLEHKEGAVETSTHNDSNGGVTSPTRTGMRTGLRKDHRDQSSCPKDQRRMPPQATTTRRWEARKKHQPSPDGTSVVVVDTGSTNSVITVDAYEYDSPAQAFVRCCQGPGEVLTHTAFAHWPPFRHVTVEHLSHVLHDRDCRACSQHSPQHSPRQCHHHTRPLAHHCTTQHLSDRSGNSRGPTHKVHTRPVPLHFPTPESERGMRGHPTSARPSPCAFATVCPWRTPRCSRSTPTSR